MHDMHRSKPAHRGPRSRAVALILALALSIAGASAQDFTVGWHPRSGDVWVDTWLGDINHYGARYPEPFIDEMVRYHNAPRVLVVDLLQTRHWAPGDVYFACTLAAVLGRPCRYVVDVYEADRGQGWGVIAQRLGIKPGSPEFHRLKNGFVPTYDRWARPIELDDDLRRVYPDRGKGKPGSYRTTPGKDQSAKGKGAGQGADAHGKSTAKGAKSGGGDGKSAHGNQGNKAQGGKGQGNKGQGSNKDQGTNKGNKGQGNSKGNGKG
jgi:hypothetical protein